MAAPLVVTASHASAAPTRHVPTRMPDLVHFSKAAAYAALAKAGLYFHANGPGSANGTWLRVVSEIPAPGSVVAWHATVTLNVTNTLVTTSSGPPVTAKPTTPASSSARAGEIRMPDLVHLSKAAAYAALTKAGLYFHANGPGSANGTWKTVRAQNPPPGVFVKPLATVTLAVSQSAAPPASRTTFTPPKPALASARVPRLVGLSRAQALAALARAGLALRTNGPGSDNGSWTRVVAQSIPAGKLVKKNTVVVVTTGRVVASPTTTTTTTTTPTSSTTTVPGETTTTVPVTSTTTPPVTTTTVTTTKVKRAPLRYRIGLATWYSYIPGRCATSYLPMGTRITVRNLATGVAISCVVTDHQDAQGGRVVDLSETQFSQLEPLWRGIVRVKVSW